MNKLLMSLCRGSSNELSQWSVFTKTWKCCGIKMLKKLKLLTRFRADPTQKQSSLHLFDGVGTAAAPIWRYMRKLSVPSYFASAIALAFCRLTNRLSSFCHRHRRLTLLPILLSHPHHHHNWFSFSPNRLNQRGSWVCLNSRRPVKETP